RLSVFQVITASVAAAIVLSLLMATTIARPLRRLQLEANALLDRRGRLRRRFTASRRRDEIGDLSRALAELTRRLEGHLRFIEGFASDVSHELKNPLASIRNVVELLDDVDDPHERKRFMTMALREIARLEHLVNSVREITLIDARLEQESVAPVALEPLLRTLIEPIALRHERVDFELAATDEELVVTASPRRLAQVFENLLDNATSFSPPDGTVTVELTREDGMATVRVRDQGPGIPAAHQDKVFQRFFSYRPNGGKGHTGLGLSIVRAIVESYGGGIAIEAVAGDATEGDNSGAVFVVRLPLTL
ncbi:MAG: ATP-binding protein, partial [Acidobacteriota bacterium]